VIDGLSTTMLAAERASAPLLLDQDNNIAMGWWSIGVLGQSLIAAQIAPLTLPVPDALTGSPVLGVSASSFHHGVHVLFADGSVRLVSPNVNSWPLDQGYRPQGAYFDGSQGWINLPPPGIWQAYATRAGGESVQ